MSRSNDASIQGPRWELARGSAGYPAAFDALDDAPPVLYGIGDASALREGLAVVGARKATPYGMHAAKLFAGIAADRGISIISGGARGCDAAAHEVAIAHGGITVAFLGGGCDEPYPACNIGLFNRIVASGGAVVSEHPWTFPPKPYTFRLRNRLIAGLAKATLVVEAGIPSGTFSTADEALAVNREVFAVPGSVFSETSRGANALIAQGAMPVVDESSFREMLDRLFFDYGGRLFSVDDACGIGGPSPAFEEGVGPEGELIRALRADPMRLEQMTDAFVDGAVPLFSTTAELMACVGRFEIQGVVERFPDGRFGVSR
ncbi:MAG: DNA-processing protein DprA [Slackia sp.]|nr:DNA-processing protein DprA [Slackia sp.]